MKTPLRYLLNPCDMDRLPLLAPLGDALASFYEWLTDGTDCPCCLGVRVLLVTLAGGCVGFILGVLA